MKRNKNAEKTQTTYKKYKKTPHEKHITWCIYSSLKVHLTYELTSSLWTGFSTTSFRWSSSDLGSFFFLACNNESGGHSCWY